MDKQDDQVRRLLATRADIFPEYDQRGFEAAFSEAFEIVDSRPIPGMHRRLYLLKARS